MQLKTTDHKYTNVMESICTQVDITIAPNDRHPGTKHSQLYVDTAVTGILQPSNTLTEDGLIAFCAALVTLSEGQNTIDVNNFTDHHYILKRGLHVANFSVMTSEQMKYVKLIDPVTLCRRLQDNPENAALYTRSQIKSSRPEDFKENY